MGNFIKTTAIGGLLFLVPLVVLTPDRVEPLDITFGEVTKSLRQFGRGSVAWLSARDTGKAQGTSMME